jgi:hypothetical protein
MADYETEPTPERPAGNACDWQFVADCFPMQLTEVDPSPKLKPIAV